MGARFSYAPTPTLAPLSQSTIRQRSNAIWLRRAKLAWSSDLIAPPPTGRPDATVTSEVRPRDRPVPRQRIRIAVANVRALVFEPDLRHGSDGERAHGLTRGSRGALHLSEQQTGGVVPNRTSACRRSIRTRAAPSSPNRRHRRISVELGQPRRPVSDRRHRRLGSCVAEFSVAGRVIGGHCFSTTDADFQSLCPGGATDASGVEAAAPCACARLRPRGQAVASLAAGLGCGEAGVARAGMRAARNDGSASAPGNHIADPGLLAAQHRRCTRRAVVRSETRPAAHRSAAWKFLRPAICRGERQPQLGRQSHRPGVRCRSIRRRRPLTAQRRHRHRDFGGKCRRQDQSCLAGLHFGRRGRRLVDARRPALNLHELLASGRSLRAWASPSTWPCRTIR